MKKQILKPIVLLGAGLFLLSSCGKNRCRRPKGPQASETRTLSQFSEVELSAPADLTIIYDTTITTPSIDIDTRESILKRIETRVVGNVLLIDFDGCYSGKDNDLKMELRLSDLTRFDLTGSGDVVCNSTIKAENFETTITGSGDIDFSVESTNVNAVISGSGNMNLYGNTKTFDAKISGSGDIEAFALHAEDVNATITGSGTIETYATDELTIQISGSGDVHYKGSPSVSSNITGSGDIRKY